MMILQDRLRRIRFTVTRLAPWAFLFDLCITPVQQLFQSAVPLILRQAVITSLSPGNRRSVGAWHRADSEVRSDRERRRKGRLFDLSQLGNQPSDTQRLDAR
jgi:hypothetical protein